MIVKIRNKIIEFKDKDKRGQQYKICCPFHNEKTPSFYYTPSTGLYNCFGCSVKGKVWGSTGSIDWQQEESLLDMTKEIETESLPEGFCQCFVGNRKVFIPQYLLNRGVDEEIIKKFGLGYVLADRKIVIPLWQKGKYYGWDSRNWVTGNKGLSKGAKKKEFLYGYDECLNNINEQNGNKIIIVEGVFDYYRIYQSGYSCVALVGKSISDDQVQLLRCLYGFRKDISIYIMIDPDCSKYDWNAILDKLGIDFEIHRCKLPAGRKDAAVCSKEEIRNCMENAK